MITQEEIYADLEKISINEDPWGKIATAYTKTSQKNLLELIKQVPHKKILEVGCAAGGFTKKLGEIADEVVGIDVSKSEIVRAKKDNSGKNITYFTASLEEYAKNNPTKYYDVIVCSEVLYYIKDSSIALAALQQLGDHIVTSHYFFYEKLISFGSFRYEWDLMKKYKSLQTITENGKWYLVKKTLWKKNLLNRKLLI